MGKTIEVSGKTVDAAVWSGLHQLGLTLDQVKVDIKQKPTSGLLGIGAKPAIVVLTEKEEQPEIDIKSLFEDKKEDKTVVYTDRKPEKRTETTVPVSRPVPERPISASQKTAHTVPTADVAVPHVPHMEEAQTEEIPERTEIEYSEEYANNNNAAKFLMGLLDKMGVEAKVSAADYEGSLRIKIDTDAAGVLIGHRGETLDAIQYITLLVANRDRNQREYTRVSIDTQGYREKREDVLVRLAKSKASAVRASGRSYKFEPMSPYERRIIHSTLQSNPNVTTHSEGEEPYRYVVITSTRPQRRRQGYRPRQSRPRPQANVEE